MKFKIVADSSCDLEKDYIKDEEVGFDIVPLSINIDSDSFLDDEQLDRLYSYQQDSSYKGRSR